MPLTHMQACLDVTFDAFLLISASRQGGFHGLRSLQLAIPGTCARLPVAPGRPHTFSMSTFRNRFFALSRPQVMDRFVSVWEISIACTFCQPSFIYMYRRSDGSLLRRSVHVGAVAAQPTPVRAAAYDEARDWSGARRRSWMNRCSGGRCMRQRLCQR